MSKSANDEIKDQENDIEKNRVQNSDDNSDDSVKAAVDDKNAIENITATTTYSSYLLAFLSCCVYSFFSVSMVLSNKGISAVVNPSLRHSLPNFTILVFQCLVGVFIVESAKCLRFTSYESFNIDTALVWLPLNILFIGMLCTGFLSLVYVSVPFVTVCKNISTLLAVAGDAYFFNERVSLKAILSIVIMTIGAIFAAANDLEFSLLGYFWVALNCTFTASYTLYMRYASVNVKLSKTGMVFYNNLLSAVLLLPLCIVHQEYKSIYKAELYTKPFVFMNVVAAVNGMLLNFSALWCISATSASSYAMLGSFNRIPITLLGFLIFDAKVTTEGLIFITLAVVGSVLYAYSRIRN